MKRREVKVMKIDTYLSVGTIATILFLDKRPPIIGDIIDYDGISYHIFGFIVTSNASLLAENVSNSIYECKLTKA